MWHSEILWFLNMLFASNPWYSLFDRNLKSSWSMSHLRTKGDANHAGQLVHASLHLLQRLTILVEVQLLGCPHNHCLPPPTPPDQGASNAIFLFTAQETDNVQKQRIHTSFVRTTKDFAKPLAWTTLMQAETSLSLYCRVPKVKREVTPLQCMHLS